MFEHTVLFKIAKAADRGVTVPPPIGGGFSVASIKQTIAPSPAFWLQRQWFEGQSEDGPIGTYAPSTIRHKIRRKLPYDRVTLFETGRLYAKTSIKLENNVFVVKVDVPYAKYLEARYGKRIWWLGGKFKEDFIFAYIEYIKKYFLRSLWLNVK